MDTVPTETMPEPPTHRRESPPDGTAHRRRPPAHDAVHRCPALLVSAPASGQGKTTLTAALAREALARGQRVRIFKVGADFIDPMILELASGAPVYQLDTWMGGVAHCRALLAGAAAQSDLILVEGAMGLYDGDPSSADLARRFGLPILAVIDAGAMAQTFGAVAFGLAHFQPGLRFAGVVANRVAGSGHAGMIERSLPPDLPLLASISERPEIALPQRQLGLAQPDAVHDIAQRIVHLAGSIDWTRPPAWPQTAFESVPADPLPPLLQDVRIAVARDAAFSFLYHANLDTLGALGAQLAFFSPLADAQVPAADALYLPGGYPELHAQHLSGNVAMREALGRFCDSGRPVLAECGGMMVLLDAVTTIDGHRVDMVGALPGHTTMQTALAALALQEVDLGHGALRGHTFHHSILSTPMQPAAQGRCPNGGRTREAVFQRGRVTASYVHLYFASNPTASAALFR